MMLALGARFPVRHLGAAAARGGRGRRAFPCQNGQDAMPRAALVVVTQSQSQPCLLPSSRAFYGVNYYTNSSRRGPSKFSPFTTSSNTREFSTSDSSSEKAGVSKSNSNAEDFTGKEMEDDALKNNRQATHTRLVFRRLYRILFRRINQLENGLLLQQQQQHAVDSSSCARDNNNSRPLLLLLQPPLNPHCVGSSRIIDNISNATVPQVLTLFYHWSLYAMGGSLDENDDENDDKKKDDLEERFTDWLNAACPDFREQENTLQRRRHQYPWQENRALDTLWIRIPVLRQAIRRAFSAAVSQPHDDGDHDVDNGQSNRQFYIQASIQAYKFMSQQLAMIPLTSTSTTASITKTTMDDETITTYDSDSGTFISTTATSTSDDGEEEQQPLEINKLIRVTAVSRWIGRSLNPSQRRTTATTTGTTASSQHDHHFVYRIRIENLTKSNDSEINMTASSSNAATGGTTVQLNGRSWEIESLPLGETDNDMKDVAPKSKNKQEGSSTRDIVKVHAPREGAVGQHPPLGPEQAFEYYSRCDLSTPIGTMQGRFYFTIISSDSDDDGDAKEPIKNRHFQVEVHPFPLRAERF